MLKAGLISLFLIVFLSGASLMAQNDAIQSGSPDIQDIPETNHASTPNPTAVFTAFPPVCIGSMIDLEINFTGTGPWNFDLLANGLPLGTVNTFDNPALITVPVNGNTIFTIDNFSDAICPGPDASIIVGITPVPQATLTLVGKDTICTGQNASFLINLSNGVGPFTYQIAVNGIAQPQQSALTVPINLSVPITANGTVELLSLSANGCTANITPAVFNMVLAPALSASIMTGKTLLCPGAMDTLRFAFSGIGPFTFSYTMNGVPQDTLITSNSTFNIPVSPALASNIYRLGFVEANGCNGAISGADTLIVYPIPTAFLTGSTEICPGDSALLCVNLSGVGPFNFSYTANGVAQPPIVAPVDPNCFYVHPTDTTTYVLTSISANGCPGTFSGSAIVTVQDSLSATVTGGGQICQGGAGTSILFHFSGIGPYTFTYSINNVVQPEITTTNNPYVLNVNPVIGTFYRITSIKNSTCTGQASSFPAIVFVFVPATAVLSGSQTVCDSISTTVMIDFTGTGPFTINYTIGGVQQPEVITDDDPYLVPVVTDSTTTVMLTGISSPGCTGIPVGSATITVNYKPSFTNVQFVCNPTTLEYILEFDVQGASLPLTLVSGSGSFTGTHFTSNPIPQAQTNYSFSFHDAINCGDVLVSGIANCNCTTSAATMQPGLINVCVGADATATFANDFVNDGNDIQAFILHTLPNDPPGTILGWSNQPTFTNIAGVVPGVTYYISAVAGNPGSGGTVDLNDPCLSISTGTPVVFRPLPTASLGNDIAICSGAQAVVPVSLTGTGPFILNWTVNSNPQTANNIPGPNYLFGFQPISTSVVILANISDAFCSRTLADTANVTVNPPPQILNLVETCNLSSSTYTLSFDAQGTGPFTLTGISATNIGNQFTSNPVASGTPYNIQLTDANMCGQDTESGNPNCACQTDAGALNTTPQLLCYGANVSILPSTGVFLEPDDALVYVLLNSGFAPVAQGSQPNFVFDPLVMIPGQTYTIVAYAGNMAPSGVDPMDPCLSVAIGATVQWREPVSAVLSGAPTICPGAQASLPVMFSGTGPFSLVYQAGTTVVPLPPTNLFQTDISVSVGSTTLLSLVSVSGAGGCAGTVSGTATVVVAPQPMIMNAMTTCDFFTNTYQLSFSVGNGVFSNVGYTITGLAGVLTDTNFVSNPIPSNQLYNVTVTSPQGCTTVITGNANCDCVTDAGTLGMGPIDLCTSAANITGIHNQDQTLEANDLLQFVLCTDPNNLPLSIIETANQPVFAVPPGVLAGDIYYIVAIAGNAIPASGIDWLEPCLSISAPTEVHFFNPPTAVIGGDTSICKNKNITFKIKFTGTAPFKFVYSINNVVQPQITAPLGSFTISSNNIQQQQVFTLVSVSDAHCTGTVTGTYTVSITPPPSASLVGVDTICLGNSASLSLNLTGGSAYDVTINGGPTPIQLNGIQNGHVFDVNPLLNTTYTISVLNAVGNTCPADLGPGVNVTVTELTTSAILSDYNGYNISCFGENDGAIQVDTNGGIPPLNISWSNGGAGLTQTQLEPGDYQVSISDQAGCMVSTNFQLIEPPELSFSAMSSHPGCTETKGSLQVEQPIGGISPYFLSINNTPGFQIDAFPYMLGNLIPGPYALELSDLNGCTASDMLNIFEPPFITVDLGPDITILQGDSVLLQPVLGGNSGLNAFEWTSNTFLRAPNQLSTYAIPDANAIVSITVEDAAGCSDTDEMLIRVEKSKRVFLPNIIRPEASNNNQVITVYGGPEVDKVLYLRIYDRWGELMFENKDFLPNDKSNGWRGTYKDKDVQPGVYIYVAEVKFDTGETQIYSGDVTVVR